MPRLPLEIYRIIIENVEQQHVSTLHALLFVSREMNREAERCLYRSIYIDPCFVHKSVETPEQRREKLLKKEDMLLRLPHDTPSYAVHLVHLNLHYLGGKGRGNFDLSQWTDFMPAIAQTCPNMKSLHLPGFHAQAFLPPCNACFRLHTLEVYDPFSIIRYEHIEFHSALAHFLESQPAIRELKASWCKLIKLSSNALPSLRILQSLASTCSWMLPGRPVEELVLEGSKAVPEFGGFDGITHLKRLTIQAPGVERLLWFSGCFIQLEYLEVTLRYWADLDDFKSMFLQMRRLHSIQMWTDWILPLEQVQYESGQPLDHASYLQRLNDLLKESRQDILTGCPRVKNCDLKFLLAQHHRDSNSDIAVLEYDMIES